MHRLVLFVWLLYLPNVRAIQYKLVDLDRKFKCTTAARDLKLRLWPIFFYIILGIDSEDKK